MAFASSLFERIENPERAVRTSLKTDASELAESVMANLRNLLNTRRGAVPLGPDYGMPDFNDMTFQFPDAIPIIGRELKQAIQKYEPRLRNIQVSHLPDPDNPISLCYRISAELVMEGDSERLQFETILGDDGHCRVR